MELTIVQEAGVNDLLKIVSELIDKQFETVIPRLEKMDPLQGNECLYDIVLDMLDDDLVVIADILYHDAIREKMEESQIRLAAAQRMLE